MNTFRDLYDFIDLAQGNRKYAESVANNLKSALKIFGQQLNEQELSSVDMIQDNIEEIFRSVANANKDKSIASLSTYKTRILRAINDYKRYGTNPEKIQNWEVKEKKLTPLFTKEDKTDKAKDKAPEALSLPKHTPVNNAHNLEIALEGGRKAVLSAPRDISVKEADLIKKILDTLTK